MRLILIRHGQAEWQTGVSASLDSPLTELGRRQAAHLGEWACREFGTAPSIRSSPLRRASATARAIGDRIGAPVGLDTDLREAPFHIGSLLPRSESPHLLAPDWERPEHLGRFTMAVRRAFGRLCAQHRADSEIVCVTHSGVIETILRTITGSAGVRFDLDNASITVLDWEDGRWHLRRLNDTTHLPPATYSN